MNAFKTIIGVILIIVSIIIIMTLANEESGTRVIGAFIGFLLSFGTGILLIRSANKSDKNE